MFGVPLVISLPLGALLSEVVLLIAPYARLRTRLHHIQMMQRAFRRATNDHIRQSLVLRLGRVTLIYSLTSFAFFLSFALLLWAPVLVLQWTKSQQAVYLVAMSLAATSWWFIRRTQYTGSHAISSAYGTPQRWLHWLALGTAAGRHLAFDLELQFALPKRLSGTPDPACGAVYVCGLARSGTTILLRILDQIDVFRSLTYRDMPFVLAPNIWKRVVRYNSPKSQPTQRAHGDGLLVDFESPEAFEEVFWRTFGKHTLTRDSLSEERSSAELLATFADYRALISNPKTEPRPASGIARRYLSKNNNNLLRLHSLCLDETATVLLMYRNPVATARSLHRQHLRFCAAQTQDRFVLHYMDWLGHYEFGLNHRPFGFARPAMDAALSPDDPNYWLDYWNAVYRYVLAQQDLPLVLVNHAALCTKPLTVLQELFGVLGIHGDAAKIVKLIVEPSFIDESTEGFDQELLQISLINYHELLRSPKNVIVHE